MLTYLSTIRQQGAVSSIIHTLQIWRKWFHWNLIFEIWRVCQSKSFSKSCCFENYNVVTSPVSSWIQSLVFKLKSFKKIPFEEKKRLSGCLPLSLWLLEIPFCLKALSLSLQWFSKHFIMTAYLCSYEAYFCSDDSCLCNRVFLSFLLIALSFKDTSKGDFPKTLAS